MKIPTFILRNMYIKQSFRIVSNGFFFSLRNSLLSETVVKIAPIVINKEKCPIENLTIINLTNNIEYLASDISEDKPMPFWVGEEFQFRQSDVSLKPGEYVILVCLHTKQTGFLEFDFTDDSIVNEGRHPDSDITLLESSPDEEAQIELGESFRESEQLADTTRPLIVLRDLGRSQNQFVFKVKVQNQSDFLISGATVMLADYPDNLLSLNGSPNRKIDNLKPGAFETVTYRFDVLSERCVGRDIHADVSYYDHRGLRHTIAVKPKVIKHVCDLLKPEEIKPEEFQTLYVGLEKATMPLSLLAPPDDESIKALTSALNESNMYTLPIERESTSVVIRAHGKGKTTGLHAAAVLFLPVSPSEPMTLEFGSEGGSMTTHGVHEIQRLMEKLCLIERKIDYVLSNSERLMVAAGESKEKMNDIQSKLLELGDRTDSTSQLAKEILALAGEKLTQVSIGQQTLNQAIGDMLARIEAISEKLGIGKSIIDKVKDAISGGAADLAKKGVGNIFWNMAKMGLIALGLPVPI